MLLKNVIQAIPTYAMSVFSLPLGLCKDLETAMNGYWWGCEGERGGGIRWRSWNVLCQPKKVGGMGFRSIKNFNLALLGKQAWRFIQYPNSLMTKIYKAKYFPKTSFFEAKLGNNPSFI